MEYVDDINITQKQKFQDVVLGILNYYIGRNGRFISKKKCEKCGTLLDQEKNAAIKQGISKENICSILYFIDFDFYEKYEEKFIGLTYKKTCSGPIPEEFDGYIESMLLDKKIEKYTDERGNDCYRGLAQSNLNMSFKIDLYDMLDGILHAISKYSYLSFSSIYMYAEGDIPLLVTDDEEVIDYQTVFYREPKYSKVK